MLRHLYLIAVVYALLICPIRCLGVESSRGEVAKAPKCSCCRHAKPADPDKKDCPCDDDCRCWHCVCHGALTVSPVAAIDHDCVNGLSGIPLALVDALTAPQVWERSSIGSDLRRDCGRTLRICCGSLLC